MTSPDPADDPAALRREIAALNEQLKLLVRTEQRLSRSQRDLDRQLRQTQALEKFALATATGLEPDQILARAIGMLVELFAVEWCTVFERQGELLRIITSTVPYPAEPPLASGAALLAHLDTRGPVAVLQLPRDLDPAVLTPVWPTDAFPLPVTRTTWLLVVRFQPAVTAAPVWLLAHAAGRAPFGEPTGETPESGASFLTLLTSHVERALENATLTQALRQRGSELAASLAELGRAHARLAEVAKLEAIGRLAGGVAHDFNNLLTVIAGHAALMTRGLPDGHPALGHAAKVSTAVEKAAGITAQLLAFGRRQIQSRVALDLNEQVSATVQMLGRLIGEHVELHLHLEASLPAVLADRAQLDQVLLNLLVNARDALPDGGHIHVTTRAAGARDLARVAPESPHGDFVLLEVKDDGHGMDGATRARIFEPFYSTKGAGQGTGLGLAVVYGIVRQSEGHLFVESEPGRGATFGVLLPVAVTPVVRAAPDPPVTGERRGARILLVEDEPMIRDLARRLLELAGHQVDEAANGREALERVRELGDVHELVLTDVVMPVMGGLALAASLRQQRPELPVLFMSGYSQEMAAGETLLGGRDRFLAKPFTQPTLLAAVAAALVRQRA